jgi:hypothetical protein
MLGAKHVRTCPTKKSHPAPAAHHSLLRHAVSNAETRDEGREARARGQRTRGEREVSWELGAPRDPRGREAKARAQAAQRPAPSSPEQRPPVELWHCPPGPRTEAGPARMSERTRTVLRALRTEDRAWTTESAFRLSKSGFRLRRAWSSERLATRD